ncbi:Fe-Mn family superoxide dismutase [Geothrix fuzhouensis]|uniref:Fe-Mn family superoxide dismutase n=1 Tax=Geothrix fuzhouensis TaxID=2966451 RepID=UPI002147992E|nr:Fe-Mn family superoxide dismutase [Geothrix fuzhouensis]
MAYEPKNYEHLKGGVMKGFSDSQLDLLLVLDSWEHAFMVDYGIKRPEYINAFMDNIKWSEVSRRFDEVSAGGRRP